MNNNIDIYEKFASNHTSADVMNEVLKETSIPRNVLRHATCTAVYPSLENEVLQEDEVRYFLVSEMKNLI